MGLIATEWNRTTLMKAAARVVSDVPSNAPPGSFRKVKLILRNGIAAFRILDVGYDANAEIGDSRTYEWAEVEAGTQIPHFELAPNQVLWGIAMTTLAQAPGIAHCSVIIEHHDGAGR